MRKRHLGRLVVLAIATTAILIGSALPASATVSTYDVKYHSGRIRVVRGIFSQNFDTPGSSVAGCPGATTISGSIEDAGGTDTIDGTLTISSPFNALGGDYILTLTGTATGTNRGDYTGGATGTFSNLLFSGASYRIETLNTTTCAPIARVCGSSGSPGTTNGTLNLNANGGVAAGSTVALSGNNALDEYDGEQIFVGASGTFTNAGCVSGSPFGIIIATNASISLGDNPNDCYLNPGTPAPPAPPAVQTCGTGSTADPGAIFTQQP